MRAARACAILALLAAATGAREPAGWSRAATSHFEIYSNADPETLRSLALNLERLHAFFVRQVGISPRAHREIRVISFASAQEYNQYRPRSGAAAFFIGAESRDYIVLPAVPRGDLRVAAHEYAHVLIHSGGWTLPEWIAEGIGDVVSTVQMRDRESRIGGDLPGRSQALKNARWMTLPELFAFTRKPGGGQPRAAKASSTRKVGRWPISSCYRPPIARRFPHCSPPSPRAYRRSALWMPSITRRSLRSSVTCVPASRAARVRFPCRPSPEPPAQVRVEAVTPFASRAMLADLRLANGDLAAAESAFRELAAERPASGEVLAALGTIALKRGDTAAAVAAWKRAVELGVADADLCFRYAVLADAARTAHANRARARRRPSPRFRRRALQPRAPGKERGSRRSGDRANCAPCARSHPRAPSPIGARWRTRCSIWTAAPKPDRPPPKPARMPPATKSASAPLQLAWLADTELAVEIEGEKFHTVRVPVGAAPRNPFIEPGDRVQRAEATMRQVDCPENGIQLVLDTAQGALTLAIPDPSRVQIRNAGSVAFEFVCGPQEARKVLVEYAPAGSIVRGLEFR